MNSIHDSCSININIYAFKGHGCPATCTPRALARPHAPQGRLPGHMHPKGHGCPATCTPRALARSYIPQGTLAFTGTHTKTQEMQEQRLLTEITSYKINAKRISHVLFTSKISMWIS